MSESLCHHPLLPRAATAHLSQSENFPPGLDQPERDARPDVPAMLGIDISRRRHATAVRLAGEGDVATVPCLRDARIAVTAGTTVPIIDLAELAFMHSAGLAPFLEAAALPWSRGRRVALRAVPPRVQELLTGLRLGSDLTPLPASPAPFLCTPKPSPTGPPSVLAAPKPRSTDDLGWWARLKVRMPCVAAGLGLLKS